MRLTLNILQFVLITIKTLFRSLYSSFVTHKSADTTGWVHFKAISHKASADLWKEIELDFTWTGHHNHDFCDDFSLSSQNHVMHSPNLCDDWNVIIIQSYVLLL